MSEPTEIDVTELEINEGDPNDFNRAYFHIGDKDEGAFNTITPGDLILNPEEDSKVKITDCTTFSYGDLSPDTHRVIVFFENKMEVI